MLIEFFSRLLFDLSTVIIPTLFFGIDRQVEAKLYTFIKFENETDLSLLMDFS